MNKKTSIWEAVSAAGIYICILITAFVITNSLAESSRYRREINQLEIAIEIYRYDNKVTQSKCIEVQNIITDMLEFGPEYPEKENAHFQYYKGKREIFTVNYSN